jgi:hypothetical protein
VFLQVALDEELLDTKSERKREKREIETERQL